MQHGWPERLWIVRHGESAGNVARAAATAAGLAWIDIAERDVDVDLSRLGERQARSLGRWFAEQPESERPEVVVVSPYRRARRTAEIMAGQGAYEPEHEFLIDERLREKEFGILDRLTTVGIRERYPEQAEFRRILGKFYHRPPGGESWCDAILRLRSALDTMAIRHAGRRVLVVSHQVVVLCMRYLVENMTEEQILAIDRKTELANCSLTIYELAGDRLELQRFNFVAPLRKEGAPVTTEPDVPLKPS
jgi:broad specificity phosphatase PhoE